MSEIIKKLTIKLGKKEIDITPEEAKQLYLELDKIFGTASPTYIPVPYKEPITYPWKRPYIWWYTDTGINPVIDDKFKITYTTNNQLLCESIK